MKDLRARVRYNRGKEGCGPDEGKVFDAESFVLETWDAEEKAWCVHCISPLRNCAEYPDASDKQFVHMDFMMSVLQLINIGYHVSLDR